MFSQACVKNSAHKGGCIPACTGTEPPPPSQTLPWSDPPDQTTSPGQTLPWSDTPLGKYPRSDIPPDRHCSGRYASYWNVFFFLCKCFHIRNFALQLQSIVRTSSFILLSSEQIVPKIEKNVQYLYNVKMFKCAFFCSPDAFVFTAMILNTQDTYVFNLLIRIGIDLSFVFHEK